MPDYNQGKIYLIGSPQTDKVYIGSTTQKLKDRFYKHKTEFCCSSRTLISLKDASIQLIENYPCESRRLLEQREQYWIEKYGDKCINIQKAFRDKKKYLKKYSQENAKKIREYKQTWCDKNRERIKLQKHLKYLEKKNEILTRSKENYHKNREQIRQRVQSRRQSLKSIADFVNFLNSL